MVIHWTLKRSLIIPQARAHESDTTYLIFICDGDMGDPVAQNRGSRRAEAEKSERMDCVKNTYYTLNQDLFSLLSSNLNGEHGTNAFI